MVTHSTIPAQLDHVADVKDYFLNSVYQDNLLSYRQRMRYDCTFLTFITNDHRGTTCGPHENPERLWGRRMVECLFPPCVGVHRHNKITWLHQSEIHEIGLIMSQPYSSYNLAQILGRIKHVFS